MPKYRVTLTEKVKYYVDVEADNEDDAGSAACDAWADSPQPDNDFCGEGQGVTVSMIHEELS